MPNALGFVRNLLYKMRPTLKKIDYVSEPTITSSQSYYDNQPIIVSLPVITLEKQPTALILEDGVLRRIYDELADRGLATELYESPTIKLRGVDRRSLGERLNGILDPMDATLQMKSGRTYVKVSSSAHQQYRNYVDGINDSRRYVLDEQLVA